MLLDIVVNFLICGFHLIGQLLLGIGLSQDSSLLKFYLQVDGPILVGSLGKRPLFSDQHLSKLPPHLLNLLIRNLATGELRVFSLSIVYELVKPCLVGRLLEKVFYLLVRDIWTGGPSSLGFEIILGQDNRSNQV